MAHVGARVVFPWQLATIVARENILISQLRISYYCRLIQYREYDGVWRSWLTRQYGVLEIPGSSPGTPTKREMSARGSSIATSSR